MRADFQFSFAPPLARLRITGELDADADDRLRDVLDCLAFRRCTSLELDVGGVSAVNLSCLRILDREARRLADAGGEFRVVAASTCFRMLSRVADFDTLRSLDEDAARDGTQRPPAGTSA